MLTGGPQSATGPEFALVTEFEHRQGLIESLCIPVGKSRFD